ncbi:MAG TPA: hypothetical protein VNA66_01660 [Gammaproteobacteria bacterium]|jgi:hypothetical protein|nr:hypothetical protein [Gammaproteobacteria bacterium]
MNTVERATANEASDIAAGDPLPAGCDSPIEVHVPELRSLFNAIDPAPFNDRDLDPSAEEFIVNWSKDLPREAPLALLVHLDRPCNLADAAEVLREAVHRFFAERARSERRRLRELFARGRVSLVIALAFVALTITATRLAAASWLVSGFGRILDESLLIVGWVAMWRPLEIFLYDWWPIRADARLFERLARMPVRVTSRAQPIPPAEPSSERSPPL